MGDTFGDKFKKAFKLGSKEKDGGDESPLAHGAHGSGNAVKDQPTAAPRSAEKSAGTTTTPAKETSHLTGKTGGGMTSGSGTGAVEGEGHQGMMDKVKAAMGGAPWQDHHDKTLEALKHAKKAHLHAMQAQASLKNAQEAQKKAENAQRRKQELEAQLEKHQSGGDLAMHKKNLDDAHAALPGHQKNYDEASRLARDAEAAAAAREADAHKMRPNDEEHSKALQPLEAEANRLTKTRTDAETKREALLRELHELESKLKPMREEEAAAHKKLNDHKHSGESSKEAHAAALAEAEGLRHKANQANKDVEPHAANLNNHKALIARHQDAHNRAQEEGKTAEGRLPELKQNLSQADKEAQEAHKEAQHHSDAFEKLKREAEAEDAKKAALWEEARKAGHLEQDGADKQDLHKFADRLHTVLRNPIDTSLLGKNPMMGKDAPKSASGATAAHPTTPERADTTSTKPAAAAEPAHEASLAGAPA
ncbi:hypothetical protein CVIRNUC_008691 [Coccomyxa viridis]|uniref:Uncharacterized protein n=1 Tax=Coccomyxa viridis TaxID=1274662 RepID=A0AAV1IFN3_9CHLO|nr:hypothetical protein CVIRNUC_008691 [Coccomyxa viridis]